jgi:RNA polymerase primary sigma factor
MRQLKITQQITIRDTKALNSYLTEVSSIGDVITQEEEIELAVKIQKGDKEAFERLVRANLRFVISVAKQYQRPDIPLEDLINEGNLGLMKAAERFDHTRGFKFISYAVWWIRQTILQYLAEHAKLVRLPGNKIGQINKVNKETAKLEQ